MLLIKNIQMDGRSYVMHTSIFRPGEFFPEHYHEFHEFFLVISGTLEHVFNGKRSLLPSGTLQLIHPEDRHLLRCAPDCPEVRICNCNVNSEEIVKLLAFLSGGHDISLDDCIQNVRLPLDASWKYLVGLTEKAQNMALNPHLRNIVMRHLTSSVFLMLMQRSDYSSPAVPQWLGDSYEAMKWKENYIKGLPRFIQLAARSQEHLCRSMKRFYGISPQEYIQELRLDRAFKLLLSSGGSISKIAYEVGFHNLSYFRRCFQKKFGASPVKFKKMRKSRCGIPSAALKKEN